MRRRDLMKSAALVFAGDVAGLGGLSRWARSWQGAWASELALRAATTLVVSAGSRSILAGEHPQRLAREALFLLVFGSRPGIKASLLERLITAPPV